MFTSVLPAASGAATPSSSRVATHFTGKVANGTPLSLVVKVKAGKIVAIKKLLTDFGGFDPCYGTGGFVNSKPINVNHDSFSNTQDALLTVQAGGYHFRITVKGKFSHNDTRVKGTLKLVDVGGPWGPPVCAASSASWNAKAK